MKEYKKIEGEFIDGSQPKPLFLIADWIGEYKLFITNDYSWTDEQLHFGKFKEKSPQPLKHRCCSS